MDDQAQWALYRRYRPDTFAEMIGQDHVTGPLQRALANDRVNHAYLLSGPRGCGKTTTARILARALNCEQGPTPTPCGQCVSCVDLARGGPGSIDVIEIDAASHGGVDDARDLRERAFFAPVVSRYKVYIVDEAHMVTTAGFNAMLKLVEEPPPHVKFVFATTEPEKVIGTIRSRTHHYPIRLVPPRTLSAYLAKLCEAEGFAVEPAVLSLVVRAGAGSVRDALSVLDQLLGSAEDGEVSYAHAASLLGYTPESLLDEMVDAMAAGDGGGVFTAVDKVIEVGQDPRRFAEDLLQRLRDLVIVAAVPDAIDSGLIDVAGDAGQRLQAQAAALGQGELTRAAEVIAEGLTEMRGTTAPRLHLELMCSRMLLPGADLDERGFHARLDRLERRLAMSATGRGSVDLTPDPSPGLSHTPTVSAPQVRVEPAPVPDDGAQADQAASNQVARDREDARPLANGEDASSPAKPLNGFGIADLRRLWPQVLEAVKRRRRYTWILLSQNAQIMGVDGAVLTLGLTNAGARDAFSRGGSDQVLVEAMVEVFGSTLQVNAIAAPGAGDQRKAGPAPQAPTAPSPSVPSSAAPSSSAPDPAASNPAAASLPAALPDADPGVATSVDSQKAGPGRDSSGQDNSGPDSSGRDGSGRDGSGEGGSRDHRRLAEQIATQTQPDSTPDGDLGGASADDEDVDDQCEDHAELLARHLGAEVIDPD